MGNQTDSPALTERNQAAEAELTQLRQQLEHARQAETGLRRQLQARDLELQQALERMHSLFDHAPNFIHIVDIDLRVTFINRGGPHISQQSIIGTKVGDHMAPSDRQRVRRKLRQVIGSSKPTSYEFPSSSGVSSERWYRTYAGPITSEGQVTGLVLITFDITEDRAKTDVLREGRRIAEAARSRDRALLESIGEGLVVIDEHGVIADINQVAAQSMGYRREELIGQWFPEVMPARDERGKEIHPLDRPTLRALSSGEVISEVVRYRRKDGSYFPVVVTVSPVELDGRPIGAIEVFRDLSRERELERAKEEFVSLASHQLRTPATGVKAYISMLRDGYSGPLTPQQQVFAQRVFESNERQLQIINDMLRVARLDAGRVVPELTSTDLVALARDIAVEQRPTLRQRRQRLQLALPATPVEAVIDAKMVRMAVENLLSNASKYTDAGGRVKLGVSRTASTVLITVEDTGVGIARADVPRLFKRFSRIDNPLSTKRGGSGLGLYLAQHVVLLHLGRITVDSTPGEGTVFTIELPLGTLPAAVPMQPTQRQRS